MAMPGTPSGVNHSSDSQKCGRNTDAARRRAPRGDRRCASAARCLRSRGRAPTSAGRAACRPAIWPRSATCAAAATAAVRRRGGGERCGRCRRGLVERARGRPRSHPQNGPKPQKCQRACVATVPERAGKGGVGVGPGSSDPGQQRDQAQPLFHFRLSLVRPGTGTGGTGSGPNVWPPGGSRSRSAFSTWSQVSS